MPLIDIVIVLIVVGVLLWLVNGPAAPYIWPPMIKAIDVITVVAIVIWLVGILLGWGWIDTVRVGHPR